MPATEWTVPLLVDWIRTYADDVAAAADDLTALDSAIGDADHGSNMKRGFAAAVTALDEKPPATCADVLKTTGMSLVSHVGGASGPLYGTFFLRLGAAAGTETTVDATTFGAGLHAALDGVRARGKAEVGDKTLIDALTPAVEAYDAALAKAADPSDDALVDAIAEATKAAAIGRDSTTPLQARRGRASYLGERSVGHQDPGATSMALLFAAAEQVTR
ncbi:dihydroxyacetone kinase subunit DhaL [Rudaeicoccus suwonensis]|uniref:Dihydroxyacetone kinase DhaL subunit n=1 Tax=Rudaeicoccus suwonensis TaxID=657409 RepID=A0A561E3K0_9MICO|nr:dihydroxyacetone kinase subunit DhaL [Rudaeicoccus suwonensis]TWE10193.1 dihydroxyacetone kinase DhaL subunit [Rudaeicoccus suwonensis]